MEIPTEGGYVQSWDEPSGTGVIALDAGGTATFARQTVTAANPGDSRDWPTAQGAFFNVSQRVLCKTSAGVAALVMPDPNAVNLDGTGQVT